MKYRFALTAFFLIFFVLFSHQKIYCQCPQIESILVDACDTGADEGLNEMVRFKVGTTAINTNVFSVSWPNNAWQGLVKNAVTASKVATLNAQISAAGGCGQLIEPTGGVLPANAKVVLVTSYNFNIALNYFGALSENVYIIFQNNADTTTGHFVNYGSTSGLRTLTITFGGGCSDSVTYQRTLLVDQLGNHTAENGATVNFTPSGTASYVNNGCVAPVEVFSVDAGNSPVTACAGTTISLLGTAQGQQSLGWSATSGNFSSPTTLATNYTIDPAATGSITLTLKATNSCNVDKTDTVVVNINAGAAPILNCGTTTSSSIQFTWAAVSGATGYSVSYQIEGGTPTSFASIGNVLNYTVNGLASGSNVTITVLPIGGVGTCFVSSSKICISNGCVPPALTITNPASVCSPATVDITSASVTAGSTGSGTLSYWTNATATTVLSNPSVIASSGTYYIKSTNGTCSDIKPVTVTINPAPVLTITNPASVCSPATVDITSASVTAGSTGSGTLSYWINATATTALPNPSVIASSGTYYIKSTNGTCSDIKPVTVTINSTPVLTITNPASVCSPATVDITSASVTAGSTGSGTLSYWTNATATTVLSNPSVIASSGTYYIKSTNGTCSDIKPVTVTINPAPVLTITNPASVCSPATVDITSASVTAGSTGSGTLSYWTNAIATTVLANPSVIASSGTYYIKSTNGTCSDIKPVTVTINSTPVLTITNPAAVCSPATVDLTSASVTAGSTGSGTLSYWTNATATTVLANPSVIAASGTYYIKSTNGACSDIKPVTVTINSTPVLAITNPASVCSPATVDITSASVTAGSTGSGTLSYWTNATATTALPNPSVIAASGTYYIKSTNGACSDIKPVTVTINSTPVLAITNPASVCSPATVDITSASVTAGSTGSGTLSYWTNATATTVLANPSVIASSGTYYIKSTNGTCSDIKPVTVTINSTPVLTITNPASVCSPATVDITTASITAGSTGSGTLSYWTNATATTALSNPSVIAASGTYYIKSTNGTCSDIKPVVVSITTGLDFEITGNCVNGSYIIEAKPLSNSFDSATATYQWKDPQGNTVGANEATLNVSNVLASTSVVEEFPITYNLMVTTIGGCSKTESYIVYGAFCSIPKGISPDGDAKNDEFDLTGIGVKELHIFNRYGTEVYHFTNYTKEWHGQSNGGDELPDGTYFYSISKVDDTNATGWVYINRKQ